MCSLETHGSVDDGRLMIQLPCGDYQYEGY